MCLALDNLHVALKAELVDVAKAVAVLLPVQFGQIIDRLVLERVIALVALVLTLAHVLPIVTDVLLIRVNFPAAVDRLATLRSATLEFHREKLLLHLKQLGEFGRMIFLSDLLEWNLAVQALRIHLILHCPDAGAAGQLQAVFVGAHERGVHDAAAQGALEPFNVVEH